jgi:hypothetical protein
VVISLYPVRISVTVHGSRGSGFRGCGFTANPPAMRDLRIYGKNRLLELFRAWLKKQIGVKARAGSSSICWLTSKFKEGKTTLNGELCGARLNLERWDRWRKSRI